MKKDRRIIPLEDTRKTLARNQHQYHWTFTEIKWKRYYCDHSGLIYKNNLIKSNNNEFLIRRNCEDLLR